MQSSPFSTQKPVESNWSHCPDQFSVCSDNLMTTDSDLSNAGSNGNFGVSDQRAKHSNTLGRFQIITIIFF